jgi:hypothetical protein
MKSMRRPLRRISRTRSRTVLKARRSIAPRGVPCHQTSHFQYSA